MYMSILHCIHHHCFRRVRDIYNCGFHCIVLLFLTILLYKQTTANAKHTETTTTTKSDMVYSCQHASMPAYFHTQTI